MTLPLDQLLTALADATASCTLSLPCDRLSLLRRSRVLACDEEGLWVAVEVSDYASLERLIEQSLPIHLSIRWQDKEVLFHSVPLSYRPNFITPKRDCVPALQLKRPESVFDSQRRKTFRVPLSELDGAAIRIWRINEYVLLRDRVLPSQELPCRAKDLSEGGFAATVLPLNQEALNLKSNQRFRVEMKFSRHQIVLEARLRYPEQTHRDDLSAECGFEFIYNDRDVESRRNQQKLQLMISEIQRSAVRAQAASV